MAARGGNKDGESTSLSFEFSPAPVIPRVASSTDAETRAEEPAVGDESTPFRVLALARVLEQTVARAFPRGVWVAGEASGVRRAQSGHVYFSLKDEEADAVLDCVLYRTSATPRTRDLLEDGARVRVRARPAFWPPRGRLQLVVDRVEPLGRGAILEALERLKAKLAAEGLFDEARKRPLPREPRVVGVVTSRSGAVIHDIAKVAFARGGARILLAPAAVQGQGAPASLLAALELIQRVGEVDVILIGRGGGSFDDLMAFNDEAVVRAVAACRVPVVSAVGHEVDVTLTDFAADARAATPSQAAELAVPDRAAQRLLLVQHRQQLERAVVASLGARRARAQELAHALGEPRLVLARASQSLDEKSVRLARTVARRLEREGRAVAKLAARLQGVHPRAVLERRRRDVLLRDRALRERLAIAVARRRASLAEAAASLDALSPLKVLGRGYSLATRADGSVVRDAAVLSPGDRVHVRVLRGTFEAEVLGAKGEEP